MMIYRGIELTVSVKWTHKTGYEFEEEQIFHKGEDITELLDEDTICEIVRFYGEESK